MSSAPRLSHWIAGSSCQGSGEIVSIDPTRPDVEIAIAPIGGPADVDRAVSAAAEAQTSWSAAAGAARAEALHRWADAIAARSAEMAEALVREVGKPIGEARGEVGRCVAILRYFAGDAVRESGAVIPSLTPGVLQYAVRRPLGVVGLITPWNFPLAIPLWKAAPALAAGNAVVLKPAEESPLAASLLAETAAASGLPAGLFNVVYGEGDTGRSLVEHEGVACVSFTGSSIAGRSVAQACASRNAKFQTEMGGKNPGIVLADADLAKAASLVASGAMRFAGQKCTATSRVFVHRGVRDAFLEELKKAIDALPVGDPADASTAVGPVIGQEAQNRLQRAISTADAECVHRVASVPDRGFFVAPTVFEVRDGASSLLREELFGPVLALVGVEDFEQALALANDTPYGLSASLFTQDLASALRYAERIEAGMVRVNADTTGVDPHAPFGGVKGSSSHSREQGPAAKEFYTEIRTVQINP